MSAVRTNLSPWPHRLAVVLACTTFPLIWVGGLVTTYDAGMAVPDWPTTYGYNLFLYPLATWIGGPWDLFIEHGHRLLAAAVGLLTIVLVGVVWVGDPRRWVRGLAVGCLLLVVAQGILGGARVLLDEILVARIHGCTGPLFFVACVATAAVTSRWWRLEEDLSQPAAATPVPAGGMADNPAAEESQENLSRLAWALFALSVLQLVLGAHLRHLSIDWPPVAFRGLVTAHLVVALAILAHGAILTTRIWRRYRTGRGRRLLRTPATAVTALLVSQLVLGVATWLVKYGWPTWLPRGNAFEAFTVQARSMTQAVIVTAHVAAGSLILATVFLVALRATRLACHASTSVETSGTRQRLEVLV